MAGADLISVREIADALQVSKQAIQKRGARGRWPHVEVTGKGGRIKKYPLSTLPPDIREAVALHQTLAAYTSAPDTTLPVPSRTSLPAPSPLPEPALPAPSTLSKWQRQAMDARCAILNLVEEMAAQTSVRRAVAKVALMAQAGSLPAHIQALVSVANARAIDDETLSERTLFRWRSLRKKGVTALAPKDKPPEVPLWAPYFLKTYRKPGKPSVADVLEDLPEILPPGMDMPSSSQCYRLLTRMSAVDRERGRKTGNDLRAIMPFRRRGTENLLPLDVVTTDGHSFKAKVAHPSHGKPFKPEVCAVVDVATRRALGWSAGLSESASTVADALRHAIQQAGIPAMLYADPGSGNTALVNSHESYGRYARMGISFSTGLPGRTQARGLIERFQKSCWIRAAKRLPSYMGSDMDGTTLYKTTRLIDSEVRKTGTSRLVMPWNMFLAFLQEAAIDAYNNRPHSALPKFVDENGRRRHMSPNECWDMWLDRGWQPEGVSEAELADMWRPRVLKTTHRAEIRIFNNVYYHPELQHYHGSQLYAEYEPQGPNYIYVRDLDERLICVAKWNANKSDYKPISQVEVAAEHRAKRRLEVIDRKRDEIELERRGATVIDVQPDPMVIEARRQLEVEMARERQVVEVIPDNDRDRWRLWQRLDRRRNEGENIPEEMERFWGSFQTTQIWRSFYETERDLLGRVQEG